MTSPRAELVALLRSTLPSTYIVRDFNSELGTIRKRTVTVQTTNVAAPLTFRSWQVSITVDVVSSHTDFDKAETDLEDALPEVLALLRDSPLSDVVGGAERIVRADRHHAWRITLTLPLKED